MILLEPHPQVSGGVFGEPGEEELVSPGHPRRRILQPFPLGVLPDGEQYLTDGPLYPGLVYPES